MARIDVERVAGKTIASSKEDIGDVVADDRDLGAGLMVQIERPRKRVN